MNAARTALTPLTDDLVLRRVTLDTVACADAGRFSSRGPAAERHTRAIRSPAGRPRADHAMGYWQDVLAENWHPQPDAQHTGPFRWWLYESSSTTSRGPVRDRLVQMRAASDSAGRPARRR